MGPCRNVGVEAFLGLINGAGGELREESSDNFDRLSADHLGHDYVPGDHLLNDVSKIRIVKRL